jgi:hypothetical protein
MAYMMLKFLLQMKNLHMITNLKENGIVKTGYPVYAALLAVKDFLIDISVLCDLHMVKFHSRDLLHSGVQNGGLDAFGSALDQGGRQGFSRSFAK